MGLPYYKYLAAFTKPDLLPGYIIRDNKSATYKEILYIKGSWAEVKDLNTKEVEFVSLYLVRTEYTIYAF